MIIDQTTQTASHADCKALSLNLKHLLVFALRMNLRQLQELGQPKEQAHVWGGWGVWSPVRRSVTGRRFKRRTVNSTDRNDSRRGGQRRSNGGGWGPQQNRVGKANGGCELCALVGEDCLAGATERHVATTTTIELAAFLLLPRQYQNRRF
eukprot:g68228.t1